MFQKGLKKKLSKVRVFVSGNGGFGMSELLGIAATLIIAAFIIIPGLTGLADKIMDRLGEWWAQTISGKIFPTTFP